MDKSQSVVNSEYTDTPVTQMLQDVLTKTYDVYLVTHNYHWNVEGVHFVALHGLFEQQYRALFLAIDEIAERIRALGAYALLYDGKSSNNALKSLSKILASESDVSIRADCMVQSLIELHENAIKSLQSAKDTANQLNDDETEDLMVQRVTAHQKAVWMLRSILK